MQREMTFTLPNIEPDKPQSERDPHIIVHYEDNGMTDLWALNECVYRWVCAVHHYKDALLDAGDYSLLTYKEWQRNMVEKCNRGVEATWQETNSYGDIEVNVRDVTKFACTLSISTKQLMQSTRGLYL